MFSIYYTVYIYIVHVKQPLDANLYATGTEFESLVEWDMPPEALLQRLRLTFSRLTFSRLHGSKTYQVQ